jgi:O-acetyl-ADP-ribose deacetylase (regulator of RNase III)
MLTYVPYWTVFDAPTQTLVNTVNCVGVMGKGLALEVRHRFPVVYQKYVGACKEGTLTIGKLQLVKTKDIWVLNFPTKVHWRGKSRLSYIEQGLKKFASTYKRRGISSIAFPPLGCANGGLEWKPVLALMERYLRPLPDVKTYVCLGRAKGDGRTAQQSVFVFAYGSNMDPAQMRDRCPKSDLSPFVAEARGWRLHFPRRSARRNSGVGSIAPDQGQSVWGVVFSVSAPDLIRLDYFEGVSRAAYRRDRITVVDQQGQVHDVWSYFAAGDSAPQEYQPSKEYIDFYIRGAEYFELPQNYVESLKAIRLRTRP